MAEITKIKAQKNKKRVNIYLDGKFTFGLPAETLVKAGLAVGQELSEKEAENLIFKNEFQKLYDKTLRIIGARHRSEKEIKDYLIKKKATPKISDKIVEKLKKLGYIDDRAFATWWIEQRSTFRPRGKFGLEMELRQKGIDKAISKKAINKKVNELSLAKKAAQKKLKTYKKLGQQEFREKMSAFLARRGFSWPVIKQVVEHVKRG